jgi:hypothetical protein
MTHSQLIHDLVEANGKTIKENNLERQHDIPLGALVEVVSGHETADDIRCCEEVSRGARLFVREHSRDCDGTPLYVLATSKWENENPFTEKRLRHMGYPRRSLVVIAEP